LWPPQRPDRWRSSELPTDFYLRELVSAETTNLEYVASLMRDYGRYCSFNLEDLTDELIAAHVKSISRQPPPSEKLRAGYHRDDILLHFRTARRAVEIWTASRTPSGLEDFVDPEVTDQVLRQVQEDNEGWPNTLEDLRTSWST